MNDRRRHILDFFRVRGSLSVGDLADELRLSHTGAASHIARLLAEGLIQQAGLRPGKRRPSALFALTSKADSLFHQEYEAVADGLVAEAGRSGRGNLTRMLRRVADRWILRDRPAVGSLRGPTRIAKALSVLTDRGLMPALERAGRRYVLHQRQCPILQLCRSNQDAPELIRYWMVGLFGAPVHRTQCIRDGHRFCEYLIGSHHA